MFCYYCPGKGSLYLFILLLGRTLDGVIKGQWARDVVEVVVNSEEKQFPLFFLDKHCGGEGRKIKNIVI